MVWTIVEVARASGVTSRTLQHYDAIGLLPPTGVGANGYREYGPAELLRLQQILVLRELGLPLEEIRAASSERYIATMSPEDQEEAQRAGTARMVRMAELRASGAEPADGRVQEEVQGVYDGIVPMWTPTAGAFAGLGASYVDTRASPRRRSRQQEERRSAGENGPISPAERVLSC